MIIKKRESYLNKILFLILIICIFIIFNSLIKNLDYSSNNKSNYLIYHNSYLTNLKNNNYLHIDYFNYSDQDELSCFIRFKPNEIRSGRAGLLTNQEQDNGFRFSLEFQPDTSTPYINFKFGTDKGWNSCNTNLIRIFKLNKEEWYQIGFSLNKNKKVVKLYINGKKIKECKINGIIKKTKGNITFGKFVNGSIKDIRIYNKTLNLNEIINLYNDIKNIEKDNFRFNEKEVKLIINDESYKKLNEKRNEAIWLGNLITSDDDYVPATIITNNKTLNASIRLKGDYLDHLISDKWSFKVKLKDNTLFGMKTFSLQAPERRGVNEWAYYKMLAEEGLIALRYIYINLTINNKSLGRYVIEEQFSKELIEHNNRTEGPILKLNEDLFWERIHYDTDLRDSSYWVSDINSFKMNSIIKDEQSYNQFIIGKSLLEFARRDEISIDKVFDIKQLAKYAAINDLMGARHGDALGNKRFYYNPVTSLIEPIGYDANAGYIHRLSYNNNLFGNLNIIDKKIKENKQFIKEYVNELIKITKDEYLENFFKKISTNIPISEEIIYKNQEFIKKKLNPLRSIQVYLKEYKNNTLTLSIGNINSLPIEIISLSYKNVTISKNEDFDKILKSYEENKPVNYSEFSFIMPIDFKYSLKKIKKLRVNFRIIGTNYLRNESIYPYPVFLENLAEKNVMLQEPNFNNFSFIKVNNNTLIIANGTYILNKTLIIPSEYYFIINPNTTIILNNNSTIISHSAIIFNGTNKNPIIIKSTDGTGQGLTILQAENESIINNTIFNNLKSPKQGWWSVTGAVTFYESSVKIFNSKFFDINAEDALNIKNSNFTLINTIFMNTKSDCIDSDFSKGIIENSKFINCGGDGIDTSGTTILIKNTQVNKTEDKGLSIGEASTANASNLIISNTYIGISSKDNSKVNVKKIIFINNTYNLAAYQKKSEYGPSNITIDNKVDKCICEYNSKIFLNRTEYQNKTSNVFNILYLSNNVKRI